MSLAHFTSSPTRLPVPVTKPICCFFFPIFQSPKHPSFLGTSQILFLVYEALFFPWRRKWQPTPVFLPGESHGQRSLVGYSPWGRKESDATEQLHFHFLPLTRSLFFFHVYYLLFIWLYQVFSCILWNLFPYVLCRPEYWSG